MVRDDNDTKRPAVDPETGEVLDDPPQRRRGRLRRLTADEQKIAEARISEKGTKLRALEALSFALLGEDDGSLRELGGLVDVSHAQPVTPLLRVSRPSGRGGPGSSLVVSRREYDGGNGGEPGTYALLHAEFHDGNGYKCRTRGAIVRRGELRPVSRALADLADALDAAGTK